jgi:hypothetical protein
MGLVVQATKLKAATGMLASHAATTTISCSHMMHWFGWFWLVWFNWFGWFGLVWLV